MGAFWKVRITIPWSILKHKQLTDLSVSGRFGYTVRSTPDSPGVFFFGIGKGHEKP
jgi:hypothetical protein